MDLLLISLLCRIFNVLHNHVINKLLFKELFQKKDAKVFLKVLYNVHMSLLRYNLWISQINHMNTRLNIFFV